jgi:hypothetical protein
VGIEKIQEMMPAPLVPKQGGEHDWKTIERSIDVAFPSDFKKFVDVYGTGSISGFLWIFNPFSSNPSLNFEASEYLVSSYESMRAIFPDVYRRRPGTWLPWAISDNGDSLSWILDGDPETWTVMIQSKEQDQEEETYLTFEPFMQKLIGNGLRSRILPDLFLAGPKVFMAAP